MKKRFKTRTNNHRIEILILLALIVIISFICTVKVLFKRQLPIKFSSEIFANYLILHELNISPSSSLENIFNINIKRPTSIVKYSLRDLVTFKEMHTDSEEIEGSTSDYIEDPHPEEVKLPLVYIYNSHQTESYSSAALADYNIAPSVQMASYLLREKLTNLNIPTIVETANISDILTQNNWPYYRSYDATRPLVEKAKNDNPSLKLFIDLHRDSSLREKTTLTKGDINYAKVLFVVGKEHANYEANLQIATLINDKIKEIDAEFSRGIYLKEGPGVNGIYNQDISPNSVLIELGGQYNTIEEASNTINLLAEIIATLLKSEDLKAY